jgi:DNA-binding CsgD family transcriptional regulator
LPSILPAILIVLAQSLACLFFVADALSEEPGSPNSGPGNVLEVSVALALMAGIVLGAIYLFHLVREIRTRAAVVAVAKGAMSRVIADRFADWRLSAAESDVALFALKGCSVQDIARMRSSAPGTVRAQLSQVYAKAGVSSQSMFMSLFLEELMGGVTLAAVE